MGNSIDKFIRKSQSVSSKIVERIDKYKLLFMIEGKEVYTIYYDEIGCLIVSGVAGTTFATSNIAEAETGYNLAKEIYIKAMTKHIENIIR